MIFTIANTIDVGRTVKRVTDANGLEYDHTLEIDTESGRIVQVKYEGGVPVLNEEGSEVVHEEVWGAPPILVQFWPDEELR